MMAAAAGMVEVLGCLQRYQWQMQCKAARVTLVGYEK